MLRPLIEAACAYAWRLRKAQLPTQREGSLVASPVKFVHRGPLHIFLLPQHNIRVYTRSHGQLISHLQESIIRVH